MSKNNMGSLEVKEINLDKEFDKCFENYIFDNRCDEYIARCLFQLGLKAKLE